MYSSKCINSLLLVSGQMGRSGSGLFTGEPNFGEGNVPGMHHDAERLG